MIRIVLCTLYDQGRKLIGDYSSERLRRYSQAHHCDWRCPANLLDSSRPASWNKVLLIQSELATSICDWVVWSDADVLIVDLSFDLAAMLDKATLPLLFSQDQAGLCAGFFCVRNCEWCKDFFNTVWFLGQTADLTRWEQPTMMIMRDNFPTVRANIGLISQDIVQNPLSPFCPTAFAAHYWARQYASQETILARMKLCAEQGWSEKSHPA